MATHVITISATTAAPTPLTISDDENHTANTTLGDQNLTTMVDAGDTVKWVISGDITKISAITDTSTINVFSTQPAPTNDGTESWSGVISNTNSANDIESYTISYYVGTNEYVEDPKLKINAGNR